MKTITNNTVCVGSEEDSMSDSNVSTGSESDDNSESENSGSENNTGSKSQTESEEDSKSESEVDDLSQDESQADSLGNVNSISNGRMDCDDKIEKGSDYDDEKSQNNSQEESLEDGSSKSNISMDNTRVVAMDVDASKPCIKRNQIGKMHIETKKENPIAYYVNTTDRSNYSSQDSLKARNVDDLMDGSWKKNVGFQQYTPEDLARKLYTKETMYFLPLHLTFKGKHVIIGIRPRNPYLDVIFMTNTTALLPTDLVAEIKANYPTGTDATNKIKVMKSSPRMVDLDTETAACILSSLVVQKNTHVTEINDPSFLYLLDQVLCQFAHYELDTKNLCAGTFATQLMKSNVKCKLIVGNSQQHLAHKHCRTLVQKLFSIPDAITPSQHCDDWCTNVGKKTEHNRTPLGMTKDGTFKIDDFYEKMMREFNKLSGKKTRSFNLPNYQFQRHMHSNIELMKRFTRTAELWDNNTEERYGDALFNIMVRSSKSSVGSYSGQPSCSTHIAPIPETVHHECEEADSDYDGDADEKGTLQRTKNKEKQRFADEVSEKAADRIEAAERKEGPAFIDDRSLATLNREAKQIHRATKRNLVSNQSKEPDSGSDVDSNEEYDSDSNSGDVTGIESDSESEDSVVVKRSKTCRYKMPDASLTAHIKSVSRAAILQGRVFLGMCDAGYLHAVEDQKTLAQLKTEFVKRTTQMIESPHDLKSAYNAFESSNKINELLINEIKRASKAKESSSDNTESKARSTNQMTQENVEKQIQMEALVEEWKEMGTTLLEKINSLQQ